jgi:hypothetical protein
VKRLGFVLLVLGTIVASLGGAKLPTASTPITAVGLAILLASLVALRWRRGGGTAAESASEHGAVQAMLTALPDRIEQLERTAAQLELPALMRELDVIEAEVLAPIAERAAKLLPELGAARFADVFSPFAASERALARAWSAAADGHRPEAEASIARALDSSRASAAAIARS